VTDRENLPPVPPPTGEEVAAFSLDLAYLARHGALAGVTEIIAERRRQLEQGDGYGNGWLRGSLGAWLLCPDWTRQDLREAGALIAAEIDGLDRPTASS